MKYSPIVPEVLAISEMYFPNIRFKIIGDSSLPKELQDILHIPYHSLKQWDYKDEELGAQYVIPPSIALASEAVKFAWEEQVKCNFKLYLGLIREGIPHIEAKSLLPSCTKIELIATYDLANIRDLVQHTLDSEVSWQIKEIAIQMESEAGKVIKNIDANH